MTLAAACAVLAPDVVVSADPARWEPTIAAFEAEDKANPPQPGGVVFVGSSSIRGWKTLAADFPDHNVINRGFGGSEMADSAHFANRIVTPYNPRMVFVYAGDNDIASGKAPEVVLKGFREFVRNVRRDAPCAKIGFISIKPSPSRWKFADKMREANELVKDYCRQYNLAYVDVFGPMLEPDGSRPRQELFLADNLHMNRAGYTLWTSLVMPYMPDVP